MSIFQPCTSLISDISQNFVLNGLQDEVRPILGILSKDNEEHDDDEPEVIFHYLGVVRMSRCHSTVHRSLSTGSSQREIVHLYVDW